ncbi:MAG: alkane 1-monooxygenase [Flavobacteriales bacterium]|nr:alkane 1-monooxygenase [Flavobacteriales bacterium]
MGSTVLLPAAVRRRVRFRAMRYLVTFIAPAWGIVSLLGHGLWTWALPIHGFLIVPLLELLLPHPPDNLSEEEEEAARQDPIFDVLLYLLVPMQWAILVLFFFQVGEAGLSWWEIAGRTASTGILCGIYGINAAHELGHRATRWERDLARALLLTSLYMHFIIEHNRGHHKRVATPDDPASARYGEWLYAFWVRSIVFSFLCAWRIEVERMRKEGHAAYGWRNEMIHALLWQGALLSAVWLAFGPLVASAFACAALIGILLLETVNYIEHYGLRRKRGTGGGWQRVQHVHSWNSDHQLGRLTLFELTRHSDHHWKASRPYQVLRSIDRAPQFPTGYPGMLILSTVPPLFFSVMHPRLNELARREKDLELAIAP